MTKPGDADAQRAAPCCQMSARSDPARPHREARGSGSCSRTASLVRECAFADAPRSAAESRQLDRYCAPGRSRAHTLSSCSHTVTLVAIGGRLLSQRPNVAEPMRRVPPETWKRARKVTPACNFAESLRRQCGARTSNCAHKRRPAAQTTSGGSRTR